MARKPGEKIRKKRQKLFNEKPLLLGHKCNVKNVFSKALKRGTSTFELYNARIFLAQAVNLNGFAKTKK